MVTPLKKMPRKFGGFFEEQMLFPLWQNPKGEGGHPTKFYTRRLRPEVQSSPDPFFIEKIHPSYTFHKK